MMGQFINISDSKFLLILMNEKNYFEHLIGSIKQIKDTVPKICYVSFTRPYSEIIEEFNEEGIDASKFYFIDAISSSGYDLTPLDNCYFTPSISINDLKGALNVAIKQKNCKMIVMDTISSLLMFENKSDIVKFTFDIVSNKDYSDINKIYFLIINLGIKKEENINLASDLKMFADKQIRLN